MWGHEANSEYKLITYKNFNYFKNFIHIFLVSANESSSKKLKICELLKIYKIKKTDKENQKGV